MKSKARFICNEDGSVEDAYKSSQIEELQKEMLPSLYPLYTLLACLLFGIIESCTR